MRDNQTEKVYSGIKRDIANGVIDLNEFIIEQAVADAYAVSKGTAAEALHRLCMEGELISYPRKGYLVKVYNDIEHTQIQRLRYTVECLGIRILIDEKSDEELQALKALLDSPADRSVYFTDNARFHLTLAESTGDKFILHSLSYLVGAMTHTLRYNSVVNLPEANLLCHEAIIEGILARDYEKAAKSLKEDMQL